jgi:purine-binding chemotaxis protein CheW
MNSSAKHSLDWAEIHRRMDAVERTLELGWKPSAERKQHVLRERAAALAREPLGAEPAGETLEVLEFLLAHERYGIELKYVREVYLLKDLTPLPGTPTFILGVANVRGQVLLIVDLKRLFELPNRGLTDLNKIIIVEAPGVELGILADSVLGLVTVPVAEIQPALPTLIGIREEFLRGVTRQSMVVLDAKKLLSVRGLVRVE